jgi:hypothetical protein
MLSGYQQCQAVGGEGKLKQKKKERKMIKDKKKRRKKARMFREPMVALSGPEVRAPDSGHQPHWLAAT